MEITTIEEWNDALKKAELNDMEAQLEVAYIFENGLTLDNKEIVAIDIKSAFNWTKKAFENGNKEAKIQYAHYLTNRENPIGVLNIE